jgi:hypothetical protein
MDDEIKVDKMGMSCSTCGRRERLTQFLFEDLKGDLVINGRIMFNVS